MKIKQTSSKSKIRPFVLAAIALALGIGALYAYERIKTDTSKSEIKPAPSVLSEEDASNKESFIDRNKESIKNGDPISEREGVTSSSSIAASASQEGDQITVKTKLYNVSSGQCNLVAANGSESVTREAPIMYQPEYSTCAGFSIPRDELGPGTWTIEITASSESSTKSTSIKLEVN